MGKKDHKSCHCSCKTKGQIYDVIPAEACLPGGLAGIHSNADKSWVSAFKVVSEVVVTPVIPAEAGIQCFKTSLNTGFLPLHTRNGRCCRNDSTSETASFAGMTNPDWCFFRGFILLLTIMLASLTLCGCGSDPNSPSGHSSFSMVDGNAGSAKVLVKRSKGVASDKPYATIKKYKVTISGPGISAPIEAEFDGTSENGVIEGVPAGSEREVKIEAINLKDRLIREGETQGIVVSGGATAQVEVEMDAVPIFVNLEDGRAIASNRLSFELFADPEDPLNVEDVDGDRSNALFDVSTNSDEVLPNISDGLARMTPRNISVGEHAFRAVSKRTGKASLVNVKVLDGSKIFPAPLFSSGHVGEAGDHVKTVRAGSAFYANAGSGAIWPRYMEVILNEGTPERSAVRGELSAVRGEGPIVRGELSAVRGELSAVRGELVEP